MSVFTLRLFGSITIGQDVLLQKQIQKILEQGYDTLILDMERVSYMDSSAVGVLAACYLEINERGGQIALTKLQPRVRKSLQILSFLDVFQVYDSNEDALMIMRGRAHAVRKEPAAALPGL